MRHIEAILFDKDGTLVDFEATWGPTYQETALALFDGDTELVDRALRSGGLRDDGRFEPGSLLAAASNHEIAENWTAYRPDLSADAIYAVIAPLFESGAVANAKPIVDLPTLFGELRGMGYRLGVATNDTEGSARRTMERIAGADALDFVVGFDSGHGGKPQPGMFNAFCGAVGVAPGAVAVIGDNLHDLEMGRRGGAGALIGVLSGGSMKAQLQPPADHVLDHVGELAALLNGR